MRMILCTLFLVLPLAAQIPITIGGTEYEIPADVAASLNQARQTDFTDPDVTDEPTPLHATVEELIVFLLQRHIGEIVKRHPTPAIETKETERRAIEKELDTLRRGTVREKVDGTTR